MSVDLSLSPWNRLAKLAPPGTTTPDLQAAADRWGVTADLYNAAADIWEEKQLTINLAPDPDTIIDPNNFLSPRVSSINQDGISISYSASVNEGDNQTTRRAQFVQIGRIIRGLRAKGKPYSPLVHARSYNPWRNMPQPEIDCETIIVVDEV